MTPWQTRAIRIHLIYSRITIGREKGKVISLVRGSHRPKNIKNTYYTTICWMKSISGRMIKKTSRRRVIGSQIISQKTYFRIVQMNLNCKTMKSRSWPPRTPSIRSKPRFLMQNCNSKIWRLWLLLREKNMNRKKSRGFLSGGIKIT